VTSHAGRAAPALSRDNVGFLLAKASQRWNELLRERFIEAGFPEISPAHGSLLLPLFEEDGLRLGELAKRARLSKQTLTTMARKLEREHLIERRPDATDARATRIYLTPRAKAFEPVAARIVAELEAEVAGTVGSRRAAALRGDLDALLELSA
jgi:DNA-binding MarR family transcriptional regulator